VAYPEETLMRVPPFDRPGEWLKANLHTHTSMSDGALPPDEVLAWYGQHGYDVVALTDHDLRTVEPAPAGLVVIPAAELSLGKSRAGAPYHLVALGLEHDDLPRAPTRGELVARLDEMGVVSFLAHPYWTQLTPEEALEVRGCVGLEVFNTGSEVENLKGLATVHWDQALTAGWRACGLAVDDSHFKVRDHGGGWIWIRAARREPAAVLAAIRDGLFYASQGPRIEEITLEGHHLHVRCSPAVAVYWIGHTHLGWSVHAADGAMLTEADFEIDGRARYVRVEVVDDAGRHAWGPPCFREPDET
jgi:hypothetical protein